MPKEININRKAKMTKEQLKAWVRNRENELQSIFSDIGLKPLKDLCSWEEKESFIDSK